MRWIIAVAIAAILLCAGAASGHRMFVGQRMTLDLYVLYDDGSPAGNATVKLYQDGALFAENVTDAQGKVSFALPGKGTGKWQYVVCHGGHTEMAAINIDSNVPVQAGSSALFVVGPLFSMLRKKQKSRCLL
ncbi:MAG: hypothetical protein A4E49_02213 [Methanosaeta sp. PtaU1.Bin112]|nr:MAG: hypothetical protein A4E49_02213 [Methanosaeta sp. PtaU1.Bin112]